MVKTKVDTKHVMNGNGITKAITKNGHSKTHSQTSNKKLIAKLKKERDISYNNSRKYMLKYIKKHKPNHSLILYPQLTLPKYIYRLNNINERVNLWKQLLPRVDLFFAVKVLDDEKIIKRCASLNTGFDVASPNEMKKVLELGGEPHKLIFANPVNEKERWRG